MARPLRIEFPVVRSITSLHAATCGSGSFTTMRIARRFWLLWPGWWSASSGAVTPTAYGSFEGHRFCLLPLQMGQDHDVLYVDLDSTAGNG